MIKKNAKPLLKAQQVSKYFGELKAVKDISFEIYPSEIFGVAGPNGSGKTVLFLTVSGFYKPDTGNIFLNNKDISYLKPHEICKLGISRTFQIPTFFSSLTIQENIWLARYYGVRHDKKPRTVTDILDFVGLLNKAKDVATKTSLLEKKRLMLAMAIITDPQLIILDEILAGLNPSEMKELMNLIEGINKRNISIVMIEHHMRELTSICSRLIILHHGEKITEGQPEEVLLNKNVIKSYLGKKFRR